MKFIFDVSIDARIRTHMRGNVSAGIGPHLSIALPFGDNALNLIVSISDQN